MKNNKITAEFVKMFWADLGHVIVRLINYSFSIKEMSHVKKRVLIIGICKQDKPKQFKKKVSTHNSLELHLQNSCWLYCK